MFLSDSRIVSHSPFACNWQTRFWHSESIVTRFPCNTYGTSNIQIPRNFVELHPAPCMRVVFYMRKLGSSHMLKQNVLPLFLLILLAKLTNQNKGICRHLILYPLRLGPPFSNDSSTLRPKVGLGSNQMKIDLRKYLWKI